MERGIRVLIANRPRLVHKRVLEKLSEQAGILVVGEAGDEEDVPSLVAETKPDFLLIALDESLRRPPLCDVLFQQFPALQIIALAPNTNGGIHYRSSMEIHSTKMEKSEKTLLEMIRSKIVQARGDLR
jgi:AmiR/NasT family two-component response regulator